MEEKRENPLGYRPIPGLLFSFAVPSIIATLVSSLYNLVDQVFIGHAVGTLGNAATNIVFPLNTTCTALALLLGIGGASAFNLSMGAKREEEAPYFIGNAFAMLVLLGCALTLISEVFLYPMLTFFGAPENVLPYAAEYCRIVAFGYPLLISSVGGGHLIRADGSPRYMLLCNLSGAVLNTFLDALFVFGFQWGMAGAALATVIGQILSFALVVRYLLHYKTIRLHLTYFIPNPKFFLRIMTLGTAPFFNQIAMMVVQVVMNKSLTYYGSQSIYGGDIPLAVAGIISKVGMIFFSIIIGTSQSMQPLVSFNYGAKKYERVMSTYKIAMTVAFLVSVASMIAFQFFPRQIIGLFGGGSEEYYLFAVRYFRIYMALILIDFAQPITSNYFTAIGKPQLGVFLSLTRQIIFLLPLYLIMPRIFGIDGLIYAGPIADALAFICTTTLAVREWKELVRLNAESKQKIETA